MAQINAELNVKNNMDTYDQMHLITNAKLVLYDNTQTGIETNNLQEVVDSVVESTAQAVVTAQQAAQTAGQVTQYETRITGLETTVSDLEQTATELETNVTNLEQNVVKIVKNKQNISIFTTGWTPITDNIGLAGATYSYTITDADITADSRVDIIFSLESYNNTLGIIPVSDSFDGGVKLYSTEEITNDLVCDYGITKQVVL